MRIFSLILLFPLFSFGQTHITTNYGDSINNWTIVYNTEWKTPEIVKYRLSEVIDQKRYSYFRKLPYTASHDDYTNTGFDRGHMAPGEHFGYGTYTMANVTPQLPRINRHLISKLESYERTYARTNGCVQVEIVVQNTIENKINGIEVPEGFWRHVTDCNGGEVYRIYIENK